MKAPSPNKIYPTSKLPHWQVTRAVALGQLRSLAAGGWYELKNDELPYAVALSFAAAWKKARGLP